MDPTLPDPDRLRGRGRGRRHRPRLILGDAVLVERDATILTGSSVGEGSIVQAGALVPEGKAFPARSVIAGTPGKVIRETTDDEVAATRRRARERRVEVP